MKKFLFLILYTGVHSFICFGQKPTNTGTRLVNYYSQTGDTSGVYVNNDSASYTYSGTRGGDLTTRPGISVFEHTAFTWYDTSVNYQFDGTAHIYRPAYRTIHTYNSANLLIRDIYQSYNAGIWYNSNKDSFVYDSRKLVIMYIEDRWNYTIPGWQGENLSRTEYDSLKRVINSISFVYNNQTFGYDTNYIVKYGYNSKGTDTFFSQQGFYGGASYYNEFRDITYNSANKITSDLMHSSTGGANYTAYYYDSNNKLTGWAFSQYTYISSYWHWVSEDSVSYFYDSKGNNTGLNYYTYNNNTWIGNDSEVYTYNTDNFLLTNLRTVFDTNGIAQNYQFTNYAYNNYDQVVQVYSKSWKGSSWVIGPYDINNHYYYSDFTNGVANPRTPTTPSLIFPNPASQTITIQTQWASPQATSGVITDVTGRVVARFEDGMNKVFTKTLSVEGWAAGVYFLKLSGEKGESLGRFEVR